MCTAKNRYDGDVRVQKGKIFNRAHEPTRSYKIDEDYKTQMNYIIRPRYKSSQSETSTEKKNTKN